MVLVKNATKKIQKNNQIKNRVDSTFSSWIYSVFYFIFHLYKNIIIGDYYFNYSIHIIYKFFLINE